MPKRKYYDDLDELLMDYRVLSDVNTDPLYDESVILKKFVEKRLKEYYETYTPSNNRKKGYFRTGRLLRSVRVHGDPRKINDKKITATVYFSEGANGRSLWGGNASWKATLIDKGWKVKKPVWFKNVPHFGFYSGSHFIDKAIKDYKDYAKQRGVKVSVRRED